VKHQLVVNGVTHTVHAAPDMPLLWVIRDFLGLTGTKFGCGQSLCGACTLHIDGNPVRSCVIPISEVAGKRITTIEALEARKLKQAWEDCDVPQCGYCQAGQLMQAAALLRDNPKPTDEQIDEAMAGNLCRCGTYVRIRKAIKQAAGA
jgi:isoquinoline 1-oxidoreductase alpha subunit